MHVPAIAILAAFQRSATFSNELAQRIAKWNIVNIGAVNVSVPPGTPSEVAHQVGTLTADRREQRRLPGDPTNEGRGSNLRLRAVVSTERFAAAHLTTGRSAAQTPDPVTLLIALKGKDGLVLAADSRGTFGDPRGITAQNDSQQKAHILAPHVAVLIAGSGEVGMMVIDEVKRKVADAGLDGATPVLSTLREIVRNRYNEWFPSVPAVVPMQLVQSGQAATRPELAFIVSGYEDGGEARLFSMISPQDFNPMLHDYGFAVQGVAQYALYLLNRLFQPNRTTEELLALAVYAITETASQDGKVGGPVNVVTIKPGADGARALSAADVVKVQETNASRSEALRDSFFKKVR